MLEDQDGFFNHQQVKDSAFTFLIAGHDTSAVGLSGVLFYLAKVSYMKVAPWHESSGHFIYIRFHAAVTNL